VPDCTAQKKEHTAKDCSMLKKGFFFFLLRHSRIWYWSAYQAARLPKRFEGVRSGPDAGLSPYSMTYPKLYNNSKSEVVI
jgi:hypothetical protein